MTTKKESTNLVLIELLATIRRVEIIKNNTSDDLTKEIGSDVVKMLGNMTRQLEMLIESESKEAAVPKK